MTKLTMPGVRVEDGLPTWKIAAENAGDVAAVGEFIRSRAGEIRDHLHEHGVLRVRGLESVRTARDFSTVISELTPGLRDYVGGTSPRTQIYDKIMTATYTPPSWSIILHQEMAYTSTMPDYISFFCENPADSGGLSTFGDMRLVLDRLNPAVRDRLAGRDLRLGRTLPSPDRVHLKPGVKKPWTEVFDTQDRARVDAIARERGWLAEWMGDDVRLYQELVPAVREHAVTGVPVWCNQAHFFSPVCMMRWAEEDGRRADHEELVCANEKHPELMDRIYLDNGDPVSEEDALHVYQVLRDLERGVRLDTTDLLIIDNLLVAHGRTAFDGDRRVLVAIANRAA